MAVYPSNHMNNKVRDVFLLYMYKQIHIHEESGIVFASCAGGRRFISRLVIPKTLNMVLDASLLSMLRARHLKDRSGTNGRSPVVDCKMCLFCLNHINVPV